MTAPQPMPTPGREHWDCFIDTHVHLYPVDDLDTVLDGAAAAVDAKGGSEPALSVLMIAETPHAPCRQRLRIRADEVSDDKRWRLRPTVDANAFVAASASSPHRILIVPGQQIRTAERLEALRFFFSSDLPDDLALSEIRARCRGHGGLLVLPWGLGKWTAERGRLLRAFLDETDANEFYLADSANRPYGWRTPPLFDVAAARGQHVLAGSDPLPVAGTRPTAGQYGVRLRAELDLDMPGAGLLVALRRSSPVAIYGRRSGLAEAFRNQLMLRLHRVPRSSSA